MTYFRKQVEMLNGEDRSGSAGRFAKYFALNECHTKAHRRPCPVVRKVITQKKILEKIRTDNGLRKRIQNGEDTLSVCYVDTFPARFPRRSTASHIAPLPFLPH